MAMMASNGAFEAALLLSLPAEAPAAFVRSVREVLDRRSVADGMRLPDEVEEDWSWEAAYILESCVNNICTHSSSNPLYPSVESGVPENRRTSVLPLVVPNCRVRSAQRHSPS